MGLRHDSHSVCSSARSLFPRADRACAAGLCWQGSRAAAWTATGCLAGVVGDSRSRLAARAACAVSGQYLVFAPTARVGLQRLPSVPTRGPFAEHVSSSLGAATCCSLSTRSGRTRGCASSRARHAIQYRICHLRTRAYHPHRPARSARQRVACAGSHPAARVSSFSARMRREGPQPRTLLPSRCRPAMASARSSTPTISNLFTPARARALGPSLHCFGCLERAA